MIELLALSLWLLFFANLWISRDSLYPGSMFTFVWALSLTALVLAQGRFFDISGQTMLVYLFGAMAFTFGSTWALTGSDIKPRPFVPYTDEQNERFLTVLKTLFYICLIGLPFYLLSVWKELEFGDPLFFQRLRELDLKEDEGRTLLDYVLGNFVIISLFVACSYAYVHKELRNVPFYYYGSILMFFFYGSAKGTKGNILTLLFIMLFIDFRKRGHVEFKKLGIIFGSGLTIFLLGLYYVNFAYMQLDWNLDTLAYLGDALMSYWIGGIVAFDNIVQHPDLYLSHHSVNRFFMETANKFGAGFVLPSFHPEFSQVSTTNDSNVYTIYFSYYKDYGMAGVLFFMTLLGYLLTKVYAVASRENPVQVIIYATLMSGLVLSTFAEFFFLRLTMFYKMAIYLALLYWLVPRIRLRREPADTEVAA